ncbi:MAG: polyprenol monophosphomannose synthase [Candidatus Bilamarchaeum sp.]|jgi:dolichol-phosphate mannosyltransferase
MISIIVPTYNEKENLPPLFSQISNSLKETDFELIIVDDNSPDQTAEFAGHLSKTYKFVRVLKRKGKLGLASAIKDGVKIANGEYLLVMDADLSHPPQTLPKLIDPIKSNDIVIGSRLMKGGEVKNWPIYRKIISRGADFIARLVLGINVSDPMSGFFIIKKDLFEKSRIKVKGYKILLNLLYDNKGAKIIEIPYTFKDRFRGKTKLDTKEMVNYLFDILRIRFG